jgi:hypothetical protein
VALKVKSRAGHGQVLVKFGIGPRRDPIRTYLTGSLAGLDQVPGKSQAVLGWVPVRSRRGPWSGLGRVLVRSRAGPGRVPARSQAGPGQVPTRSRASPSQVRVGSQRVPKQVLVKS